MNILFLLSDDSGRWGRGGLFTALETRSAEPRRVYELAGKMKGKKQSRGKGQGWAKTEEDTLDSASCGLNGPG